MAWRRQISQSLVPSTAPRGPSSVSAAITAVALAANEDPQALLREVREFRAALPRQRAIADAMDSVAVSTLENRTAEAGVPILHTAFDLDLARERAHPSRPREHRRGLFAAAGLLVIALISGATVALAAQHSQTQDRTRVAALEFNATQQYGVLALAIQDHSPGQIVAACNALHASLLPLIQEARSDSHAATTAMVLLTNERALLMGGPTQTDSIATALQDSQTLLTQLQNTTNAPPPQAALSPVVLPPSSVPTRPTVAPTTGPTPAPTADPPVQPTPTPVHTPTPEPSPVQTPISSPTSDPVNLLPNASTTPSPASPSP